VLAVVPVPDVEAPVAWVVAASCASRASTLRDWVEWMETLRSKYEVARMEGLRGHQSIWKAQFVPGLSSPGRKMANK
jgi:hypothetical protein